MIVIIKERKRGFNMAINQNIFIHEDDRAALKSLHSIPGFTQLTKAFMKTWNEKIMYIDNLSTNIEINDKQLKKYHDMLVPICKKLEIDVPSLFLKRDVVPNAYTSGDEKPFIVLTTGLLDTIPEHLIPTVLAHECGHIVCHHVLYRTMGQVLMSGTSLGILNPAVKALLTYPLVSSFTYWLRCSEYSADRAAIICDESADKIVELCMYFAGYDKKYDKKMNIDNFLNQANTYKKMIEEDKKHKTLENVLTTNRSHPLNVLRASEAYDWYHSEGYKKALDYLHNKNNGDILIDFNQKDLIGKNYQTVSDRLKNSGFNKISLNRVTDNNIFYKEDNVISVEINGDNTYKDGDWLDCNDEIKINFYKPYSEEEMMNKAGMIKVPYSSSYYAGKNVKDVEMSLFEHGIVNTKLIPVRDVYDKKNKLLNKVVSVNVNDNKISKNDHINMNDVVEIVYHDLALDII